MTAETAGMTDGVTELMATDFGAVNPADVVSSQATPAVTDAGAVLDSGGSPFPSSPEDFAQVPPTSPAEVAKAPTASPSDVVKAPAGSVAPPAGAQSPSLTQQAMEWARKNKQLAAGILQTSGHMIAGIGQGAGAYLTEKQKLENQKLLTEYYRRFVRQGSSGGAGVNLGFKPKQSGLVQKLMS
jgi:hypothetical protein